MTKFTIGDQVIVAQRDLFDDAMYGRIGMVMTPSDKTGIVDVYFPELGVYEFIEDSTLEHYKEAIVHG